MPMRRRFCDAADVEGGQGGHVEDPGAQEGAEPRQRPDAAAQVRDHAAARQGGGSRRGGWVYVQGSKVISFQGGAILPKNCRFYVERCVKLFLHV